MMEKNLLLPLRDEIMIDEIITTQFLKNFPPVTMLFIRQDFTIVL